MDTFASVLLRISDGLKKDNLEAMKFLCSDDIGKKKLEKVVNGIQLFQYLQEMQKIGVGNTQYLRTLLTNIKRPDLLEILYEFEKHGPGPQEDLPDAEEQGQCLRCQAAIFIMWGQCAIKAFLLFWSSRKKIKPRLYYPTPHGGWLW